MTYAQKKKKLDDFYYNRLKPHFKARENFCKDHPIIENDEQRAEIYELEDNCRKALAEYQALEHSLFDYE